MCVCVSVCVCVCDDMYMKSPRVTGLKLLGHMINPLLHQTCFLEIL